MEHSQKSAQMHSFQVGDGEGYVEDGYFDAKLTNAADASGMRRMGKPQELNVRTPRTPGCSSYWKSTAKFESDCSATLKPLPCLGSMSS